MEETQIHLNGILEKISTRIRELDQSIADGEREVEGMHEYYWENYTEMDQYGYENFDNQQALLNQVNANQALLLQRSRLRSMLDSPYFGRVDFRFEGEDEAESFYIGIGGFSEKKGMIPLIYDWRAPVSGLFYDFDKGEAYYEAPGGRIKGEIVSKWQYKIRSGKIRYAFESDVKIDDEVLRQELGGSGDNKLKNIIRTIQKEQNQIIRNTQDKIMVIQGVAGSGKTSVALHRIAYLLYHDREHLKSSNVLILSPNSVFSDYISHILPELGEERIKEMSFDLFAYHELSDIVQDCEDRYDEIERRLRQERNPAGGKKDTRAKESKEFLSDLREYVLMAEDELMQFSDFKFRAFTRSAREIMELFYYKFPDLPLLSRMDAVMEYFADEYETLTGKNFAPEELEEIRNRFYKMYRTRDLYVIYSEFLEQYGYGGLPHVPKERRMLEYQDVYPLLYMKYLLLSHTQHKQIRHLIIDEMQDYSYLQYLILGELFHCRMTILGDKAQTMDDKMSDTLEFLPHIFGKQIRKIHMNKSYRNTMEIAAYASEMVGDSQMELFERHGEPVTQMEFLNLEEAMKEVLSQYEKNRDCGYETTAVLAMDEEQASFLYKWLSRQERLSELLSENQKLSYVDKNSSHFCKGITVTTFYLAKGLEFEQVFTLYDTRYAEKPLHRQGRYICATRAMHVLYLYGILPEKKETVLTDHVRKWNR